ncbi:hypothetical protein LPJ66_010873 [Kickxella alabastrina]|uniref:Uncharacterized protein n=1 Tax=Kickxella alabastrina TaxID=61397 RepID=A0ACC1I3E4_9FUNG|nr:hypothetical protein LPJ66_010873 [Kickxella alabastrina]
MSTTSTLLSLSATTTTTTAPTLNPFDEDTIFTDWVTPGLVSGLFVGLIFVVLISVGISWMASIQTPKNMPTMKQKKNQ